MTSQLAKLAFCLKKLGGDPLDDFVLNHELLDVAQRMGLDLNLSFAWSERSPMPGPRSQELTARIGQINLALGNGEQLKMLSREFGGLADSCRHIRRRLWEHKPDDVSYGHWLKVLCHVAWDRPLPGTTFQRRQALDTLYGVPKSRYDHILAAVV